MDEVGEVRGGWARCCFVCRRPGPLSLLAESDGRLVAGVCAECAFQGQVLWAVPGALGFFFPGAVLTFSCRAPLLALRPVA